MNSNCCGAEIVMADKDGHGKCSNCKENCVPDDEVKIMDCYVRTDMMVKLEEFSKTGKTSFEDFVKYIK